MLFTAFDGNGEDCLWETTDNANAPRLILRKCDVPVVVWELIEQSYDVVQSARTIGDDN